MVVIAPFLGAVAILSRAVLALPRPNGAIEDEVVGRQLASETASANAAQATGASSNYGSSSASNYGSSGSSSYGSSGSSGSSNYGSSGSSNYGSSGSSNYGSSGNSNSQWSSSMIVAATSTAAASYSTATYGSGSSSWGGSGYDSCVSQCMASFGAPPATYTPPTSTSGYSGSSGSGNSSSGSSGSGATHTVIVAPTQGVLRYVPFALNASVGDTIQFMWGANEHTVTKSSELLPCNKTLDTPFASGEQNQSFVFTQVVNDTNPTFYYCGTPTHCEKGMFGIINPPNAIGAPTSVSGMMQNLSSSDPNVAAYASMTDTNTANNTNAAQWGGSMDMSSLPSWSYSLFAENVLYTRNFLAQNPEVLQEDGSINLGAGGTTPLMIPQDVAAALSNAPAASGSASSAPAASTEAPPASTSAPATTAAESTSNGASSLASSRALVGFVVIATFFAL